MRYKSRKKETLQIITTLIILIAIPISVIGTQNVNDIRNRAQEQEQVPVEIITDLTSEKNTSVYTEIPYEKKIELNGQYAEEATLSLGCNKDICEDLCPEEPFAAPSQLNLNAEENTLYWSNTGNEVIPSSWNITLSAVASKPDGSYACDVENFTINLLDKSDKENESPICGIMIPKQNDLQLPQDQQLGLTLWATDYDSGLESTQIEFKQDENVIKTISWDLNSQSTTIINKDSSPELIFPTQELGEYQLSAKVTDTTGLTTTCEASQERRLSVVYPGENGAPEFTSDPYSDSQPGTTININQSYTYEVSAIDTDSDTPLDYFVLNNSEWLRFNETKNIDGIFEGRFTGTPTVPGSYTAVFALNDGMHNHYSTQIWVISVNDVDNDTPVVRISQLTSNKITNGTDVKLNWSISDTSEISDINLYYSTNPAETSTWTKIADINLNASSYTWETQNISAGEYFLILQATDDESPSLTGTGISEKITITQTNEESSEETDDNETDQTQIPTTSPKISNIQPANSKQVDNTKPVISADLTASEGYLIDESKISLELDNQTVTYDSEIRGSGTNSGSIVYQPQFALSSGDHKISLNFYDTSGKLAHKSWTFSIANEETSNNDKEDESIKILGLEVNKRTLSIIGIGILLVILAISVPWLLLAAWKRSKTEIDDRWKSGIETEPQPQKPSGIWKPSIPQTNTSEQTPTVIDFSDEEVSAKKIKQNESITLPNIKKVKRLKMQQINDSESQKEAVSQQKLQNKKISTESINPKNLNSIEELQNALKQISEDSKKITPKSELPEVTSQEPKEEKDPNLEDIAHKPKLSIEDFFKKKSEKNDNKKPPTPPNPIRPIA